MAPTLHVTGGEFIQLYSKLNITPHLVCCIRRNCPFPFVSHPFVSASFLSIALFLLLFKDDECLTGAQPWGKSMNNASCSWIINSTRWNSEIIRLAPLPWHACTESIVTTDPGLGTLFCCSDALWRVAWPSCTSSLHRPLLCCVEERVPIMKALRWCDLQLPFLKRSTAMINLCFFQL